MFFFFPNKSFKKFLLIFPVLIIPCHRSAAISRTELQDYKEGHVLQYYFLKSYCSNYHIRSEHSQIPHVVTGQISHLTVVKTPTLSLSKACFLVLRLKPSRAFM